MEALKTGSKGTIQARKGKAVPLQKGQSLKVINTHGNQVIDFFAFGLDASMNFPEIGDHSYLSMQHTRAVNLSLTPRAGDVLYDNFRQPILKFVEDSSPGVHDTIIPACDLERYRLLGVTEHHESCMENLYKTLQAIGYPVAANLIPAPFNLWMNVPVGDNRRLSFAAPVSKPGDYCIFTAQENSVIAMSACPQDITPVNGLDPKDCHFEII